jgi:glycosyltransferase involved in cell wall biosynthesis
LLARADLTIVSADRLLRSKQAADVRTVLVRHGVDYELFRRALDPETEIPAEVADLPRPVLGFFGLLSPDWIDAELLEKIARRFAGGSLALIGSVRMDLSRLNLPNVHVLGRRPYESLPAYCKAFDVGLIPFVVSELTLNANPLKAREYLAAGLPVVSTALPEVAVLPECRLAGTHDDFLAQVELALQDARPRPHRSALMRHESWQARLDEIEEHWRRRNEPSGGSQP